MGRGKYKVTLSSRADKMIAAHAEFLARVSASAARGLLTDFRKAMSSIAENPARYPYADSIDAAGIPLNMYRKCLFCGRYKAFS